jgi:indole-3-glycerol phosphate synthase
MDATIAPPFRRREPPCYSLEAMDWRHLEQTRAAGSALALSEIKPSTRDFTQYLGVGRRSLAIVPLITRRDPVTNVALPALDIAAFAAAADELEIAGFAVATEAKVLGGRLADLTTVATAASAPVLRYDCVVGDQRLYESRAAGADAILVPVEVAADALSRLITLARELHVAVVAEVATNDECEAAIRARAPVLALAPRCLALAARIPARVPLLAHENIAEPGDLRDLVGVVDGVILGGAVLAASDPVVRLAAFVEAAAEVSA